MLNLCVLNFWVLELNDKIHIFLNLVAFKFVSVKFVMTFNVRICLYCVLNLNVSHLHAFNSDGLHVCKDITCASFFGL